MIELFGTPACGKCRTAKLILAKEKIDYVFVDVSMKTEYAEFEIPFLHVGDGSYVYGFKNVLLWARGFRSIQAG